MTVKNDTGTTREDELLAQVYQQAVGARAEEYAAAYDADAGLARFTGWLQDHAAVERGPGADHPMAELYSLHYESLLRLATLLVRDTATAEDVVQDAFVAMHDGWQRLRNAEHALAYLRQAVVNRSRSVLRHRIIAAKDLPEAPPDHPGAEHEALALLERSEVVAALGELPERQREAIVLCYYGALSEDQIAATMGISRGAVKSHTARGLASLRSAFEQAAAQPARPEDGEHQPSDASMFVKDSGEDSSTG